MIRRNFLKIMALSAGGVLLPTSYLHAAKPARVMDLRFWTAPDHTRIVFDLDKRVSHSLVHLSSPNRMVIRLKNAQWTLDPARLQVDDPIVDDFRVSNASGFLNIEFRLKTDVEPRSYIIKPVGDKLRRLVIDLKHRKGTPVAKNEIEQSGGPKTLPLRRVGRDVIVVIDPGHGGEDPGAVGQGGTLEKEIALAVAKKFHRRLNQIQGFKAHLTRTGDYHVSLKQRVTIAREKNADLFISLHADAFKISSARGASVYCLSERGKPEPDRAIRRLVQQENGADLIGGVDLAQVADNEVRGILMDLSQRDSLNRALVFAGNLLASLKTVPSLKLHFRDIKQAGFAVLKAPDIPSVLVEMAFLSNRDEERLLRREDHQEALVRALTNGTQTFVQTSQLA